MKARGKRMEKVAEARKSGRLVEEQWRLVEAKK
jgi:hypothetical protein